MSEAKAPVVQPVAQKTIDKSKPAEAPKAEAPKAETKPKKVKYFCVRNVLCSGKHYRIGDEFVGTEDQVKDLLRSGAIKEG